MSINNDDNDDSNKGEPRAQKQTTTTTRILDKKMQEQLKQRRDERLLFERFQNAASYRLNQLSRLAEESARRTSADTNGGNFAMGEEEKKIISNMNGMGLKEGVVASLATFIILRRGPVYLTRWMNRRRFQQQPHSNNNHYADNNIPSQRPHGNGDYQLSDPNASSSGNNPFQRAAAANHKFNAGWIGGGGGVLATTTVPRTKRSFIARSIWFVFDVTLSLMMGASISMAYTDTEKIRNQILEIPLVSGRSLTADALCDDVVQELVKVQEERDPTYERLRKPILKSRKEGQQHQVASISPASYYLDGIVQFCENCQRRRYVERLVRQEKGLDNDQPVEIPSPGVDRNGPRLVISTAGREMVVDNGNYTNDSNESDYNNSDFHAQFGSPDDMDWADDFVSDQQDADPGRRT